MAAGVIQAPGTEFGPCKDECQHLDCKQTREMAAHICSYCSEAIGYERRFYNLAKYDEPMDLVHARCREDDIEKQRLEAKNNRFENMDNNELLAALMHECHKDNQSEMAVNMSMEVLRRLESTQQKK